MPEQLRRRPLTSPLPTNGRSEYSQSIGSAVKKHRIKPRNPTTGWTTRNGSDVLINPPPKGKIYQKRAKWAWQERATRSDIFANHSTSSSTTSQPRANQPQRWPWQIRAHKSSPLLFFGRKADPAIMADDSDNEENKQQRQKQPTSPKWPWQARAMQSMIFDQPEEPVSTPKPYQWDQRKCNPFFGDEDPSINSSSDSQSQGENHSADTITKSKSKGKGKANFPWQEKARESNIFKSLEAEAYKGRRYPWDQRRSTYDVQPDANAKFDGKSQYNSDYRKKNRIDAASLPPAGKRCYGVDDSDRGFLNDGSCTRTGTPAHTPRDLDSRRVKATTEGERLELGGSFSNKPPSPYHHLIPIGPIPTGGGDDIELKRKVNFTVLQDLERPAAGLSKRMEELDINGNVKQQKQQQQQVTIKEEPKEPIARISMSRIGVGSGSSPSSTQISTQRPHIVDLD